MTAQPKTCYSKSPRRLSGQRKQDCSTQKLNFIKKTIEEIAQLVIVAEGGDSCGKTIVKDPGRQWFSA
ncbi:hypothetical protein KP77_01860 [Jeotgalibacillus alimentarius]|uniref:Uncharacterized protein n=1 Tax=Jeotgalibacillus alimentarius TaxID=135826 RepID=A0A0C2WAJ3_9BACL|nr:hypothetical protein KP77_01860 [Jeotgalibacillus alimentarius]